MRLIYLLATIALIFASSSASKEDDEVGFSDFALYIGDNIEIGGYTVELIEIRDVRDSITVMRVFKTGQALDEQRVFLENSANRFDEGAEKGGLTVTVVDVFDEESAKVRVEYLKKLGTPKKRISERESRGTGTSPNLVVQKIFSKNQSSIGDEIKVTISVKNIGGGRASDITVIDQPPLPEFSYLAGYPPKIKSQLDPGESDSADYYIDAVKEGAVKVPSIDVRYYDSKKNIKSNISAPSQIIVGPRSRPDLDISLSPSGSVPFGKSGLLNISISNVGKAPAEKVEIRSEIKPSGGLEVADLDRTYFEIAPGAKENYSVELFGRSSGEYLVEIKASYQDGDGALLKEASAKIAVLEPEYKYMYFLLIIPAILIAAWIVKRYREYKY